MKILLISTAFNGMTQRIRQELLQSNHTVSVELAISSKHMLEAVALFKPDLIICPFLTKRVPAEIWQNNPCLIVHPGIEGDRGPSSIDWAILQEKNSWGVTLLQASDEMDAGNIWGTANFALHCNYSKSKAYRGEVIRIASKLVGYAVRNVENNTISTRALDYTNKNVKGQLMPKMDQSIRKIDWLLDDTKTVLRKIRCADSCPGVLINIAGQNLYAFGAYQEKELVGPPGNVVATNHDSVCIATIDGAVWIRQFKVKPTNGNKTLKLPASLVLNKFRQPLPTYLPNKDIVNYDLGYLGDEISIEFKGNVAYLHFDFYNGAMDTNQCARLTDAFLSLKDNNDINVIVLMGGDQFWSNGIHLKVIESTENPAEESWKNINAIDDLVQEILLCENKLTVAAIRNNAGAGGAMMALACDKVVVRDGVILNPHYNTMGLYGSEYWTYTLPKRVGQKMADKLTTECLPILASYANKINFSDELFDEDWRKFHCQLESYCKNLAEIVTFPDRILTKKLEREINESIKPLDEYRRQELLYMHECFFDEKSLYHIERKKFVYKEPVLETPKRLAIHRVHQHNLDLEILR